MSGEPGSSCSNAGQEDLNTGVNKQPSNSVKIDRQPNKNVTFYSLPSKLQERQTIKKFQGSSRLTISADVHKILAPEESLLLTGETSSHVLKKHSL